MENLNSQRSRCSAPLVGCGSKHSESAQAATDPPAVEVRVQKAQQTTIPQSEELVGTVRSRLRATLEAKQSGRIETMSVKLGDRVSAGTVLAKLDLPETAARLAQASASLNQAQREWNRVSSLFDQQSSHRAERDAAEGRLRTAEAAVAKLKHCLATGTSLRLSTASNKKMGRSRRLATPGKPAH